MIVMEINLAELITAMFQILPDTYRAYVVLGIVILIVGLGCIWFYKKNIVPTNEEDMIGMTGRANEILLNTLEAIDEKTVILSKRIREHEEENVKLKEKILQLDTENKNLRAEMDLLRKSINAMKQQRQ